MTGSGHSIGLLLPQLRHHLDDETITDVLINNETEVWIEQAGHLQRVDDLPPGAIDATLERVLTPLGRRLDRLSPMVDARLDDGTRVCAVIAPIAAAGTCAAFRLFRRRRFEPGDFSPEESASAIVECLEHIDVSGANVLISGATGSGKTS
ncbi:MAG: ATPase, T2SS/T4P/T4SS family, partial [Actinomycetota bacterium]